MNTPTDKGAATPNALLPCPFCGMKPVFHDFKDGTAIGAVCPEGSPCRGSKLFLCFDTDNREKAIGAWNTRAAAPPQPCAPDDFAKGVKAAADWVRDRRFAHEEEHGYIEPDTNALSYGRGAHANAKEEYNCELCEIEEGIRGLVPSPTAGHAVEAGEPIDMLLFCPQCGEQHVDAPQPEKDWTNPPHRSHECQECGHVWRPADVATNGGLTIRTKGARDGNARPRYYATAKDFEDATAERLGREVEPVAQANDGYEAMRVALAPGLSFDEWWSSVWVDVLDNHLDPRFVAMTAWLAARMSLREETIVSDDQYKKVEPDALLLLRKLRDCDLGEAFKREIDAVLAEPPPASVKPEWREPNIEDAFAALNAFDAHQDENKHALFVESMLSALNAINARVPPAGQEKAG